VTEHVYIAVNVYICIREVLVSNLSGEILIIFFVFLSPSRQMPEFSPDYGTAVSYEIHFPGYSCSPSQYHNNVT
jgi:hypothetical protein